MSFARPIAGLLCTAVAALPVSGQRAADLASLKGAGIYGPGACGGAEKPSFATEYPGEASVAYKGRLFLLDEFHRPKTELRVPKAPEGATKLKYRGHRFWAVGQDRAILQFDPGRRAWFPKLLSRTSFEDFEIAFDGRIILVCTPTHLAEFHHPGAAEADCTLPYPALPDLPASDKALPDYPWFFWKAPIFGVDQEFLLLYFPNLGRLYRLDLLKADCEEVEVPWSRLDLAAAAGELRETGLISLTGRPSVGCIEFVPESSTQLRVAYQMSNGSYRFVEPEDPDGRGRIETLRPSTEKGMHWFLLDLKAGSRSQTYDEPGLRLPLALDGQGRWVPPEAQLGN